MDIETEKKRGLLLTFWLIVMLITNAGVAITYLLGSGLIAFISPNVPLWAIYVFGISCAFNVVFTIFLFLWKKWAFFAYCGMAGIAFVINLAIGIGLSSILGLVGPIILYLILRPKWNLLV